MSYNENRRRVFEIYKINPANRSYNCHHIVTRDDYRQGLVPPDFDINALSNLYPMEISEHKKLHKRMEFLDLDYKGEKVEPKLKARVIDPQEIAKQRTVLAIDLKKWLAHKNQREFITRLELQQWRQGYLEDCG